MKHNAPPAAPVVLQNNPSRNFLTEAVIGSLPRALSLSERQTIMASTPLSPSLNLLSSLPSDKASWGCYGAGGCW